MLQGTKCRGGAAGMIAALVVGCGGVCGVAGVSWADGVQVGGTAVSEPDQAKLAAMLRDPVGLPNFDARIGADGEPVASVKVGMEKVLAGRAADRAKAIERLRGLVANLSIDEDVMFGTPRFVRSWSQMLTGDNVGAAPLAVVKDFIAENGAIFEIDGAEVANARVTRDFVTDHNGVRHVTLQQQIGGFDLFDAGIKANVSKEGRLINVSSTMLPRPKGDFVVKGGGMSDLEAIRAAAKAVGISVTQDPTRNGEPKAGSQQQAWNNSPDFRGDQAITSQRVWFPMTREDIRAAWWVTIPTKGVGHTYEMVIDASDGTVLHRKNQLNNEVGEVTMRVYTGRSPTPGQGLATATGFQFPFDSRRLVTIRPSDVAAWSPFGWMDTNGVAGADFTDTRGNNVDAHLDKNADNVADLPRPNGGVGLVFDPVQNNGADPLSWGDASVVQGFYYANWYHDRLYALGFNEVSGNFQTNNYGRGGAQNDAVQLDCQDGSGTNNANFGTPADGAAGRCQMYRFTGPTPDRDSALDGDVMFHELTHGLSNRLTGGPANASALSATQSGGMGEGWSDFVALCLESVVGDNPNATLNTGAYVTNNYYNSIRRYPYCTDMTKNPLTWDAYGTSGTTATGVTRSTEVHNTGEIWCQTLVECRAGLFKRYGFAGNNLILQLVVDGLKLQPANPTFAQARDAILQADLADNGGANQFTLWTAFAKRGLGVSFATTSSAATAVTQAFDVPAVAESGDAGELPATAQVVSGNGTLTQIDGALTTGNVDLYRIGICDFANFSATTVGLTGLNTQLFLFDSTGRAVTFNDDAAATTQSRITGSFLTANGDYYIAISGADRDPVSAGGEMFVDAPTTTERQPTGPGAAGTLTGWTGTDATAGGTYSIQFTGACASTLGDVAQQARALTAFGAPSPSVFTYGTGGLTQFKVYVDPGTLPTSTGVTVSLNATVVGLGTLTLLDNGVAPDSAANDRVFTAQGTLGVLLPGNYELPYHVADGQGRVVDGIALLTVVDPAGACCLSGGTCVFQGNLACTTAGGVYKGASVPCEVLPCRNKTETEPNNSIAQATNAMGHFVAYTGNLYQMGFSGTISSSTDADYFNIGALQAGDVITISDSGSPSGRGTNTDPYIRLYRAGSTAVLAFDDDSGPGFDSLLWRYTVTTADTYIVRGYRANTTNTGTYQIGISLENSGTAPNTGGSFTAEVEANETIATADDASNAWRPVQYIASTAGSITVGDTDYLSYTFHAGDLVSANVVSAGVLDARVTLLDSAGTTLAFEDGTSVGPTGGLDSPIFGYVIPATGTYYLNVGAASGSGNYYAVVYLSTTVPPPLPCPADFNGVGGITVQDIFDFLGAWFAGSPTADFNGVNGVSVQDIFDFLGAWFAGC
jgi:Zn-dependent metalloprotease